MAVALIKTAKQLQVYWAGDCSSVFSCDNGLRQGGVASPVLFSVYFDELIKRLSESGAGCHVRHKFVGALAYADDVTLMAPSLQGLDTLLKECELFAIEYDVTFNNKKTVCIALGERESFASDAITLHGVLLAWCNEVKHLGNVITQSLADDSDIRVKANDFVKRVNSIIVNFRNVPQIVCNKLFDSQSFFYGSQMWDLTRERCIEKFHVQWRKSIRRLWNLPWCTQSHVLHHLINKRPFIDQLGARFMKLYKAVKHGHNSVTQLLLEVSNECKGILWKNHAFVMKRETLNDFDDEITAAMLIELTECKEGSRVLDNFTKDDIDAIIYYTATY
jgi:hypothetical protein